MTSTQILKLNKIDDSAIVRPGSIKPVAKNDANVSAIRKLIAKLGGK